MDSKSPWAHVFSCAFLLGVLFNRSAFPCIPAATNILLVTVDTLRADHLACYGYRFIQTPNIDALSQDGILYENCISQVPLTLPSHCTILTGTYPQFHGVR